MLPPWEDIAGLALAQYTPSLPSRAGQRHRHRRPPLAVRISRAALRGAARLIAFPLYPEYIVYKKLEIAWK